MRLLEDRSGVVTIVEPDGRIDSATAPLFLERMAALVNAGAARLVVDFRNVVYITSAGFRSLLVAARLVEQAQGKLVLCGVTGEVRRLFDLIAFSDLFIICGTREEGVAKAT